MSNQNANLLLRALSPEVRESVIAQCKYVDLNTRTSLQSQEEKPRYAFFLTAGVASIVVALPEGGSSETCLVGSEGVTSALALLGNSVPPTTTFMQVAGAGYRILFADLHKLFLDSAELRTRILEHIQQLSMTTSQVAACNNAHDTEARLARWLLMVHDRTHTDQFLLTQEFLSEMLGTRRSTVAVAAGALQRSGFIEYSRGKVSILSREALETAACDCYGVTQRLLQGLYPAHEPVR